MAGYQKSDTQPSVVRKKKPIRFVIIGSCLGLSIIFLSILTGGFTGYRSARQEIERAGIFADFQLLQEQFFLGLRDFNEGNIELARQRFEFILERDPNFPGATDRLVDTLRILYATSTPTPIPPSPTLTPTHDLRPVEELFALANDYYNLSNWNNVIDTLTSLRKENPEYRVVEVDSLLYRTLRNRGIQKIEAESSLEGGIYDLTLAERFGPIDIEADRWRNLARLYMIGLSFWEVYPEQAVYYFSQVAAAAPYLRDASGWTASGRYRAALLQYADQLAGAGDWCTAEIQYQIALSLGADERVQPTAFFAQVQCSPPTNTPTVTQTATETPTVTLFATPFQTIMVTPSVTLTSPPVIYTSTATLVPTVESSSTTTPVFTPTITSQPTTTSTATEVLIPSSTPTPSPTSG